MVATVALVGLSVLVARIVSAAEALDTRRQRIDVVLLVLAALVGLGAALLAGMEESWWPLAFATGFIVVLALSGLVGQRFPGKEKLLAGLLFAFVGTWAVVVAYVVASRGAANEEAFGPVARWFFFFFCVAAATTASTSLLRNLQRGSSADDAGRQISFAALSLLAALPFVFAFMAPGVGSFLIVDNNRLAAAAVMWAALFGIVVLGFPLIRRASPTVNVLLVTSLVCVVALASLFLARQRGLDLARQVFMGSRITQSGFGLFSIRASIVCLKTSTETLIDTKWPYVYLGQSQGMLVLYDLRRRETYRVRAERGDKSALGNPKSLPVFVPASGVTVSVARLIDPDAHTVVPVRFGQYRTGGRWRC